MSASNPLDDALIGTTVVGRYRIQRVLGEGGMGRVYVAEHTAIQKRVALKVLREEFSERGEIVTRFQQEAISASRIKHPHVLEIFDFGRLEGGPFFLVMELLEGRDLANELRRVRTIDLLTGMRIAFQICSGLGAAHGRGVVHRDMKPDNVFLQHADSGVVAVKIVDFGIAQLRDEGERIGPESDRARLTKAGTILGTPEYMAPEQGAGRRADHRADIYAVGVILYEMFTGHVPFSAPTFVETLAKHQSEPPPPMPPGVSQELRAVVVRALAKSPDERFQRMTDFERALAATPEGAMAARQAARVQSFTPMASSANSSTMGGTHTPGSLASGSGRRTGSVPHAVVPAPRSPSRVTPRPPRLETPVGTEAYVIRTAPAAGRRYALAALGAAFTLIVATFVVKLSGTGGSNNSAASPRIEPSRAASASLGAGSTAHVPASGTGPFDVEVTSDPPGASLRKFGKLVCPSTPCRLSTTSDEVVELEATKGRLRAALRRKLRPGESVSLALVESGLRLCNVEVDGVWYGPCSERAAK